MAGWEKLLLLGIGLMIGVFTILAIWIYKVLNDE